MSGILRALMWLLSAATLLLSPISLLYIIRIIYIHHIGIAAIGDSLTIPAFLFSTALGISLHELAHVVATLASGARVFEIGILTHWIFFKGAYVLNDSDYSCRPIEQIRISMAGIEMNLILSATFLLFALAHPAWGEFGLCGSFTNLWMACWNMFAKDTDGTTTMEIILGDDILNRSIFDVVMSLFNAKRGDGRRKTLLHYLACVGFGIVRLIPVLYFWAVLCILLDVRISLGISLTYLMYFTLFFMLGLIIWLILCSFADLRLNTVRLLKDRHYGKEVV